MTESNQNSPATVPDQPEAKLPLKKGMPVVIALVAILAILGIANVTSLLRGNKKAAPTSSLPMRPVSPNAQQVSSFEQQQKLQAEHDAEEKQKQQELIAAMQQLQAAEGAPGPESASAAPMTTAQRDTIYGASSNAPQRTSNLSEAQAERKQRTLALEKQKQDAINSGTVALDFAHSGEVPASAAVVQPVVGAPQTEVAGNTTSSATSGKPATVETKANAKTDPMEPYPFDQYQGRLYRIFEGTVLEGVVTNHIDGRFSGPILVMLTTDYYSHDHQQLAKTRSKDRVLHAGTYMRAIFREAVEQDFLLKDPARSIKAPSNLRDTDKTTLSWDQLRAALSRLPLRDRLLLTLDMTNALRPSELFGLRWSCFDPELCQIEIKETTYKGKIRPWGKTKASLAKVPIAPVLADELVAWRQQCREAQQRKKHVRGPSADDPNAFIFPARGGGFIDSSNYRNRVLHKLANELGLPKLTFQVIRRTIATLAGDKGHVKDIQGMMRHTRLATTTDVYMQSLESGVRSTINSIHDELIGSATPGTEPPPTVKSQTNREEPRNALAVQNSRAFPQERIRATRGEVAASAPARGVVLEFATRMRQSERRKIV